MVNDTVYYYAADTISFQTGMSAVEKQRASASSAMEVWEILISILDILVRRFL